MQISIRFFSYLKDVTGLTAMTAELPAGSTVANLHEHLMARFPKLAGIQNSTLIAVGVEHQGRDHVLNEGDEVSFFPPVQGG